MLRLAVFYFVLALLVPVERAWFSVVRAAKYMSSFINWRRRIEWIVEATSENDWFKGVCVMYGEHELARVFHVPRDGTYSVTLWARPGVRGQLECFEGIKSFEDAILIVMRDLEGYKT